MYLETWLRRSNVKRLNHRDRSLWLFIKTITGQMEPKFVMAFFQSHCVTFFIAQPGSFFNTYYLSVIWTCMSIIHTFPGEFVGASPPWPADQDELLCAAQI